MANFKNIHMELKSSIFDKELSQVRNMTWLPWVGDKYANSEFKVLIVAESHYTNGDKPDEVEKSKEDMLHDVLCTRTVVKECPYNKEWQNNMFDNLHRTLVGTTDFDTSILWDQIAFFNHIQRPMDYNGVVKERPNFVDFLKGWEVLVDVVKILKPDFCLYVGVEASNYFNNAMSYIGVDHKEVEWLPDRQQAYPRRMSLSIGDYKLPILAIKHTSQYFSWEFWRTFLFKEARMMMRHISSLCGINDNWAKEQITIEPDTSWIPLLPTHLGHKPIVACDYTKIEDSDVRFMSVGRAIYAREEDLSVKIWRHNGDRWKRSSEEVPIARLADAFLLLLSSIKSSQDPNLHDNLSYLQEQKVSESDIPFLVDCIKNSGGRLKTSLKEIQRILSDINIDNL